MNAAIKTPTISDVINDCFEKTQDRDKAYSMAIATINNDTALLNKFAAELIEIAVRESINKLCSHIRSQAWVQLQRDGAGTMADQAITKSKLSAEGNRVLIMEMPLSKGPLGDYDATMLDEEASMYEVLARTMNSRAFWFRSLIVALPEGKKVRQFYDEQALYALQQKAGV
jgi:hypothetical protein